MISEIFVDQDGVLSDFKKRYAQLYKADPEEDYNASNTKRKNLHKKRFHDFIENKQFAVLEPMPDFKEGLEYLKGIHKQHKIPICILTSTANEDYIKELSAQKGFWLKKYNVPFHPVFVPGKKYKHYYSKPGRILIDDTKSTIDNWNGMGGIGIHHLSWKDTIKRINSLL
nr:MAG: hypothetical protein [Caudoviricetes sp.]